MLNSPGSKARVITSEGLGSPGWLPSPYLHRGACCPLPLPGPFQWQHSAHSTSRAPRLHPPSLGQYLFLDGPSPCDPMSFQKDRDEVPSPSPCGFTVPQGCTAPVLRRPPAPCGSPHPFGRHTGYWSHGVRGVRQVLRRGHLSPL